MTSKPEFRASPGKERVQTDGENNVLAFSIENFQYSIIGRLIIFRLLHDRDMKILITSKGSTTGTGKTTLAILIARFANAVSNKIFQRNIAWSAEKFSFMNVNEYLEAYRDAPKGSALITDELEYLADRRRSMSNQNVFFSQAWEMLRYRNMVTIGTAPSMWDLDKRIPENSDIWINVIYQGYANTYYLTVNDFTGEIVRKRLKLHGFRESIRWPDLEGDPDYEYLKQTKKDIGIPGLDSDKMLDKADLKEAERDVRQQIAINLLKDKKDGKLNKTQAWIGDKTGYSQQTIAKLKREYLKD